MVWGKYFIEVLWLGGRAQWVQVFTANTFSMSLLPENHMGDGENEHPQVILWSPHMPHMNTDRTQAHM